MKKYLIVVAALIEKDKKFLLCRRKLNDSYGGFWEFPGGVVEKNETKRKAIEREIKEETSLGIKAYRYLKRFKDENKTLIIDIALFKCRILSGKPQPIDCMDLGFFSLKNIGTLNLAPADKKIFSYLRLRHKKYRPVGTPKYKPVS